MWFKVIRSLIYVDELSNPIMLQIVLGIRIFYKASKLV